MEFLLWCYPFSLCPVISSYYVLSDFVTDLFSCSLSIPVFHYENVITLYTHLTKYGVEWGAQWLSG